MKFDNSPVIHRFSFRVIQIYGTFNRLLVRFTPSGAGDCGAVKRWMYKS